MARIAREHIVTPSGGFFHVFNRVAGAPCYLPFQHPRARRQFMAWLRYCLSCSCIRCASNMLMHNHYHLIVHASEFRELPRQELHSYAQARWGRRWRLKTRHWTDHRWLQFNRDLFSLDVFMRDLQGPFARWFNRHFDRRGHLWAERYGCVALEDLRAVQECLFYIELNPVRAGLCKRPEDWKESSAYLRWLGQDRDLIGLQELFPDVDTTQLLIHYRGALLYRGMHPRKATHQAIDPGMVRMEEARGFTRPGLYLERLRYLSNGLILGAFDQVQDHLDRLRARGIYKRRRNPIPQHAGLFTLREQRSHSSP